MFGWPCKLSVKVCRYKALLFLTQIKDVQLRQEFVGCLPTANFCFNFNNIVDLLNCKNQFSKKNLNIPLNRDNFEVLRESAQQLILYITSLETGRQKYFGWWEKNRVFRIDNMLNKYFPVV